MASGVRHLSWIKNYKQTNKLIECTTLNRKGVKKRPREVWGDEVDKKRRSM